MTRLTVLVAIHHRVAAWTISSPYVEELRARFPHVVFLHAVDRAEALSLAPDADIAFTLVLSQEAVAAATRLRWLHCSAHSVSHFPIGELAARGIRVTNSRGIQSTPIAEHVMGGLLALARRLPTALRHQEKRVWAPNEFVAEASPWSVAGKTMAIVGLGTLGRAIATRAIAFGMRVIAMRRHPERGAPAGIDRVVGPDQVRDLVDDADVVVLAAPWTPETNEILDRRAIDGLKPGAIVINVARGQLLDERALVDALSAGRLGGAVLDVFDTEPLPADNPLWSLPNVIATPHMSGFRQDHFAAVVELFSENLRRYESGAELLNTVDLSAGY